jgi:hypothetical protein
MRVIRGALIAAMLLGCDEASSGPMQPETEVTSSEPVESGTSAAAATTDPIEPTRGFFFPGPPGGTFVGTGFTVISKLSLPAGKYIANASAVLNSNDPEHRFVDCTFRLSGSNKGELSRGMLGGTGFDTFVSLPLTIGFAVRAPTALEVACVAEVAGVVFSQSSPITAIRVDRLTIVQP